MEVLLKAEVTKQEHSTGPGASLLHSLVHDNTNLPSHSSLCLPRHVHICSHSCHGVGGRPKAVIPVV